MPSQIQKDEFHIVYQTLHNIYPLLALQVLMDDIRFVCGKTSKKDKLLFEKFFDDEKKILLQKILLKKLPILQAEDFEKIHILFKKSIEYKNMKKIQKIQEFSNFLRKSLSLVEILSGVEPRDWQEIKEDRQHFFEREIAPLVKDFQRNTAQYWLWRLKNLI